MIRDYTRHAYARAILEELVRYLRERFLETELPARERLVCEEVFFSDREIPQDAFLDMVERLQRIEQGERDQMQQYEMRRRPPPEAPNEVPRHESRPRPFRKRR